VEGVYIAEVDEQKKPKPETEHFIDCDTVLLSVGLIPENELTRMAGITLNPITGGPDVNQYQQTSKEHIFACGNVVHVNDLVDNVSIESHTAGYYAAKHALAQVSAATGTVECKAGENVRYICPHEIKLGGEGQDVSLFFRVSQPKKDVVIRASIADRILLEKKAYRMNPGEMERLAINTKGFMDGQQLTITVEEDI